MKIEVAPAAYCGRYCGRCLCFIEGTCDGCRSDLGSRWGRCAVHSCAMARGFEHCGLCHDLPCRKLLEVNSVFGRSKGALTRSLRERAQAGTCEWVRRQKARRRVFEWTTDMRAVWTSHLRRAGRGRACMSR